MSPGTTRIGDQRCEVRGNGEIAITFQFLCFSNGRSTACADYCSLDGRVANLCTTVADSNYCFGARQNHMEQLSFWA